MLHPSLPLFPVVVVLLVAESHSFATQHNAQQIINNDFGVAQLALSLVINQMSLLKILNESSTCSLQERELQKIVELEVKSGDLRNELQATKETALNELKNTTTAILNETKTINEEAAQDLQDFKEASLNELQDMKAAIIEELRQQGTKRHKTYKKYESNVTQAQAIEACEQLGGRLALPTNKEEDDEIRKEIGISFPPLTWNEMYWISGTDQQQEGTWTDSITGETLSYTNFLGGQPDNAGGVQDCLIVSPSFAGWDDVSCTNARPCYVCEYANE